MKDFSVCTVTDGDAQPNRSPVFDVYHFTEIYHKVKTNPCFLGGIFRNHLQRWRIYVKIMVKFPFKVE